MTKYTCRTNNVFNDHDRLEVTVWAQWDSLKRFENESVKDAIDRVKPINNLAKDTADLRAQKICEYLNSSQFNYQIQSKNESLIYLINTLICVVKDYFRQSKEAI